MQLCPPTLAVLSRLFSAEQLGAQGHSAPSCCLMSPWERLCPQSGLWMLLATGGAGEDFQGSLDCLMPAHQWLLNGICEARNLTDWILVRGVLFHQRASFFLPPWGLGTGLPLEPSPFPSPWEEEVVMLQFFSTTP